MKQERAKKVNSRIFPGIQGGPLMHVIAAKAVALKEAAAPEFTAYCEQVIRNAQALAETLISEGFDVVSGGTDNHLLMLDVRSAKLTGKVAEQVLQLADITTNKNMIPGDPESPFVTSGLRLGSPAMTTRGFGEQEFVQVGRWIAKLLRHPEDAEVAGAVRAEVNALCARFPLPY